MGCFPAAWLLGEGMAEVTQKLIWKEAKRPQLDWIKCKQNRPGNSAMPSCPSLSRPLCSKYRVWRSVGERRRGFNPRAGGRCSGRQRVGSAPCSGHAGNLRKGCPNGADGGLGARGGRGCSHGRWGVPGNRLARPCPGRLKAGKTIKFIMGDPGELGIFQEYISPSQKNLWRWWIWWNRISLWPARLCEVYYSHCILIPRPDEAA